MSNTTPGRKVQSVTYPGGEFTLTQAATHNSLSKATMIKRVKEGLMNGQLKQAGLVKKPTVGRPEFTYAVAA